MPNIIANGIFSGGTAGNPVSGYVDSQSVTWINSAQTQHSGSIYYQSYGSFTGTTAVSNGSSTAISLLYANIAMPQLQYEVHGIINVQSTSIATDSAGIFGQMQFPAVNTFNYVAVDYVPNNATVRTYYWQGGVQSSVATTNLTINAGAQIVLRLAFDGFNNVQAWYSTVIGDYGNSTGSWVAAGSPIFLPVGLQSAGYIGVYGANTLSGYNASDGVQKVLAFYNTSGGGGSGGAIVDIRGRMQIVQPGIINNIRDSV